MHSNRPFAAGRAALMARTPARAAALLCVAAVAVAAVSVAACTGDRPPLPSAPDEAQLRRLPSAVTAWGPAVNLGPVVNSSFGELGPAISPDGLALYFYSSRPGGSGGNDIWVTRRANLHAPWEAPRNLGPLINTSASDFTPALSPDGRQLYFASGRPDGFGDADIWVSRRDDTSDDLSWQAPVNLGPAINTPQVEAAPFVLKVRGRTTLFFSRGAVITNLDLFVSVERRGTFGDAVAVAELNTPDATEAHATLRRDGREIFFYSNRHGGAGLNDIWASTRQSPNHPWGTPVNVGPLNTPFNDLHPAVDLRGETLFFASDRPDGSGGNDLYVATRARRK